MTMISDNLVQVHARIAAACQQAGREPGSVKLLAVSKTFGADAVQQAFDAGQRAFGENYVQEGVDKILALRHLPMEWHMIGPVQSNKTRLVAENFAWVHSVDRLKTAQRLCGSDRGAINLLRDGAYHMTAWVNQRDHVVEHLKANPLLAGRQSVVGRVVLEKRTIHIENTATDPEFFPSGPLAAENTRLGVRLIRFNTDLPSCKRNRFVA